MSSGDDRTSEEATIVRAAMRLARRLRQSAPSTELTGGGLGLLVTLSQGGPMSAAALARCEGLQPQSLSRLLARMERDGLIERKADVADRRRGVIAVTRRGLEALNGAMSQRRRWLSAVMTDRLNEQERSILLQAAELMLRIAS
ncbi:MarR family transcriptional regulator [Sphingobium sp. BYY-5]|uniref:MarR family winged helix-turn-helix transcriptional regulator n=1 Tax=Sphingobium sp. BYY-5 TaxID=2926400 RepID=UPI001FA7DEAF|nr:MarR family transcriptional regulator [Sphingobium sp. BYY-5]MCI4588862.1 MarR family transcriptional regulator [Sphingobium sp. BYY-5]